MNNLKSLRKNMNLTQKVLAEGIGHTISSIGHYESGRRSPDIKTCHQIVAVLSAHGKQISIEDVFPHPGQAD